MRDIVYYLTLGFSNPQGTPSITVHEGEIQSAELQTWNFIQLSFMTFRFLKDNLMKNVNVDLSCTCLHYMQLLMENLRWIAQQPILLRRKSKQVTFNSIVSASPSSHGSGTTSTSSPMWSVQSPTSLHPPRREVRATRPKRRILTWWQGCFGR